MNKDEQLFREDIYTKFKEVFKYLFKKYPAKEAAGILKISMVDSFPNRNYAEEFMNIFRGY